MASNTENRYSQSHHIQLEIQVCWDSTSNQLCPLTHVKLLRNLGVLDLSEMKLWQLLGVMQGLLAQ